jgi:hypothetical protein
MEFFFEAFGKISGVGKSHLQGHFGDIAEVGF